jgi:hypothetical protein
LDSPSTNQTNDQKAACRRFPVLIGLNQPIARQGVIGSSKTASKAERNVMRHSNSNPPHPLIYPLIYVSKITENT